MQNPQGEYATVNCSVPFALTSGAASAQGEPGNAGASVAAALAPRGAEGREDACEGEGEEEGEGEGEDEDPMAALSTELQEVLLSCELDHVRRAGRGAPGGACQAPQAEGAGRGAWA